jgi:hypothetical protein
VNSRDFTPFSPVSKTLVTVSDDAKVEIWNTEILSLEQLMINGCNWIKDYLDHNVIVNEGDRKICHSFQ